MTLKMQRDYVNIEEGDGQEKIKSKRLKEVGCIDKKIGKLCVSARLGIIRKIKNDKLKSRKNQ